MTAARVSKPPAAGPGKALGRAFMLALFRCPMLLALLGPLARPSAAESRPGVFPDESIPVGGAPRTYRLVVPESVDLTRPAPLVIAFHGMGIDSKDLMPRYTQLDRAASKHQFLIAFPAAREGRWGLAPQQIAADLALFDALVAKLSADYKIDDKRIYVLGMSNGGYFAHVVGRERSKTVAAVASHSGPLGLETLGGIRAERKFPVIIVHGKRDRLFPVSIARENRDKYEREGHEVKLVEIDDLGHFWGVRAGASDTIWEFFAAHPLK
jgi:polyhydroxybutyrate depolymerase